MFIALNIDTKAEIARSNDRAALAKIATQAVGREGFCIREANPAKIVTGPRWCTSDGEWWV